MPDICIPGVPWQAPPQIGNLTPAPAIFVTEVATNEIYFINSGSNPSVAVGAGAGTGGSASLDPSFPCNASGILQVVTGTLPSASSIIVTFTFGSAWQDAVQNVVIVVPTDATTAALSGTQMPFASAPISAQWQLNSNTVPLAASTTYNWFYLVMPYS